jgi:2-hydroxycyclohexanecarboxyl-CoA dehydrogenase
MSRVAVVTGGASGMGLAICRRLADAGNRVAVLDLDGEAAEAAASDIRAAGGAALASKVDVVERAAVDEALAKVRAEFGPIEIMVTSAGLDMFEKFTEISAESWDRVIAVNLTGTFHCLQAAVPDMLAGGWGRIVTISSSSAQSGAARMGHYVASKGGVIALTRALAVEYAAKGITVNTIPPAVIDTPMVRRAEAAGDVPSIDAIAARTPVRRAGTPDDIAAACAFLCSEDASYITGQIIGVNGGWVI